MIDGVFRGDTDHIRETGSEKEFSGESQERTESGKSDKLAMTEKTTADGQAPMSEFEGSR